MSKTKERLQRYLLAKQDPALAMLEYLESVDEMAKKTIEETVAKIISEAQQKFEKEVAEFISVIPQLKQKVEADLAKHIKEKQILIKGEKGDPFYKPRKGIDYFDGKDGKDGKDGRGKDGKDGRDGKDGKDGSPDLPEQVRNKLETLKGNKRLDQSAIKGLDEFLKQINRIVTQRLREGGGSGGGMGKVLHQTFAGNGVATTFSLSSAPTASGNAIWVYYNGQFLVKGTHYNVSGSTITTTFVPDNGTSIDVTWIR